DPHDRADGDQLLRAADQEDHHARTAEERQPDLQSELAAEAIAESPHRQEQAGEDEQVAVHDPLQGRGGGVECIAKARQPAVQPRVVEPEDAQRERQDDERLPAPRVRRRRNGQHFACRQGCRVHVFDSYAACGRPTSGDSSSSSGSSGASIVTRGSARSRVRGMYQALLPSRCMTAGTSSIRTIRASTRIATPRPSPNDFTVRSGVSTKAQKTVPMMIAAATITRPTAETPAGTASRASPRLRYSSRIRLARKTS